MKKIFVLMMCLVIGLFAAVATADVGAGYTVGNGVPNSAHDMSVGAYAATNDPLDRICIFCHAPHNTIRGDSGTDATWVATGTNTVAPSAYTYLPLWNHALTTSTFNMYYNGLGAPDPLTSVKGSQAIMLLNATGAQPGAVSLLCLSCHDGSVAVNTFGTGALNTSTTIQPTGSWNQGGVPANSIAAAFQIGAATGEVGS